jgi:hypothetical protein
MLKIDQSILKVILLLFAFNIFSCSGGTASSSFGLPSSSLLPPDAVEGSSDGITSPFQFYVGVDKEINSISHVHASGDFTRACSFLPNDASKDITCIVEAPEAEFGFKGLGLKYNVPPEMCYYLERSPYWYYSKEVGIGPSAISVYQEFSTDQTKMLDYSTSVDSSPSAKVLSYPEVEIDMTTTPPTFTCVYDRRKGNGANCCSGSYSYSYLKRTHPTSTTTLDTTTVTSSTWGPQDASCIGGAGSEWPVKTSTGIPLLFVELSKKGLLNKSYKVNAPSPLRMSTLHVANFYTPSLHTHTGFGPPLPTRTSNRPYFIDPIDDRNGSPILSGSDYYEFTCKDQAYETLRKIKLYAREWDTYQDYVDYIVTKGTSTTANPDRGLGVEGINCAGISGPCNDFYDIDDFVVLQLGGSYPTTPADVTSRSSYFPND